MVRKTTQRKGQLQGLVGWQGLRGNISAASNIGGHQLTKTPLKIAKRCIEASEGNQTRQSVAACDENSLKNRQNLVGDIGDENLSYMIADHKTPMRRGTALGLVKRNKGDEHTD
jgi:hypothetical protein